MFFITEEAEYGVAEFYKRFSNKLPQIVKVTQGYCGEVTQEIFDRDQVIRLHTVSHQKRVLAKTTLQGQENVLSIPMTYDRVKLCVVDNKGQVGSEQFLAHILGPKTKLPITVQFSRDKILPFGSRSIATNHMTSLELVQTYDEISILGNFVNGQALSKEVTSLPLYLEQMRISVVTGIAGAPDLTWQTFNKNIEQNTVKIDYRLEYGNPEISEYHELEVAESDQDDGLYEYMAAPPSNLEQSVRSKDVKTGARPPHMSKSSTKPVGQITAMESTNSRPTQENTDKGDLDKAYVNTKFEPTVNTNIAGTKGNYTNMQFSSRSQYQTSNNSPGVKCDTKSDNLNSQSANKANAASQSAVNTRKQLQTPPTTAAKPDGARRVQQRSQNSKSIDDGQSPTTPIAALGNRSFHSSTNKDTGVEQGRRRHGSDNQTPPALPPRPQNNSKPLINNKQLERKYENVLPRNHVTPMVKTPAEGIPAAPKGTQPTNRSMILSPNIPESKGNKVNESNIDKPTIDQQRQKTLSYVSTPGIAVCNNQSSLITRETKPITKTDANNGSTPATAQNTNTKTGGMFGNNQANPNQTKSNQRNSSENETRTTTNVDGSSEIKVPNPKMAIENMVKTNPKPLSKHVRSVEDISKFRIEDVSEHLKMLGLGQYVDAFKEQMVDGNLLVELDKDIFVKDFGMKTIEAIRLVKFVKTAHIPT